MKIGHICLTAPETAASERFAGLVAALAAGRQDVEQHVLVASVTLARRLAGLDRVSVGPVVASPIMAYCLMPNVDLVHIHEACSGQAGLLLTLTRKIPYVISIRDSDANEQNPLSRAVLRRAAHTMPVKTTNSGKLSASKQMRIYEDAVSRTPRGYRQLA